MKIFLLILTILGALSCSHHHNKTAHHHHQFNKMCAYEVSQNHFDVPGNEDFKMIHNGEAYYFSDSEKMASFQKDLDVNIQRSTDNWKRKGPPSSRK